MSERKWDNFCWKCHKDSYDEVSCSKCVLSFHKNCIADQNRCKSGWHCPECKLLAETEKNRSLNDNDLDELLKHCVERVSHKSGRFTVPNGYTTSKHLINPITFHEILEKTKNAEYSSANEFLLDFKWLQHNCYILKNYCKKDDKDAKKAYGETLEKAKVLFKHCEDEVRDLRLCGDCYIRGDQEDAFISVCSEPHLVLWAKYATYPYWPAKLFKIHEGRKPLEVYFFKEYNSARVSYEDCFLYSKGDPNIYFTDKDKAGISAAAEEANRYIQNIEAKFGTVRLPVRFTKPTAGELFTKQLDEMIPGFRNPDQRTLHIDHDTIEISQPNDNDASNSDNVKSEQATTTIQSNERVDVMIASQQRSIPVTKTFLEKVHQYRENIAALKAEYQLQKDTIIQLQTEIESMKKEVVHAKTHNWCTKCLQQIQTDNATLCEKCIQLHVTPVEQNIEADPEV
ncbi:MYND-type zinc finger-containing chromatin reader Zmynd8-like isoform X2 [Sitodiplosis mosellana]|nr:MYND-type zinc finger-containing chromatin reader Zmynd8-like isoform X2 [Sitodiplosis mosellana]